MIHDLRYYEATHKDLLKTWAKNNDKELTRIRDKAIKDLSRPIKSGQVLQTYRLFKDLTGTIHQIKSGTIIPDDDQIMWMRTMDQVSIWVCNELLLSRSVFPLDPEWVLSE